MTKMNKSKSESDIQCGRMAKAGWQRQDGRGRMAEVQLLSKTRIKPQINTTTDSKKFFLKTFKLPCGGKLFYSKLFRAYCTILPTCGAITVRLKRSYRWRTMMHLEYVSG